MHVEQECLEGCHPSFIRMKTSQRSHPPPQVPEHLNQGGTAKPSPCGPRSPGTDGAFPRAVFA